MSGDDTPATMPVAAGQTAPERGSGGDPAPGHVEGRAVPPSAPEAPQREITGRDVSEHGLDLPAVLERLRNDDRNAAGQFTPGHFRNLKHGLRSARLWSASPLRELVAEREAGILSDVGGDANVSRVERPLVREYARLDVLVEAAGERVIRDGLETTKGKARAAATLYLALLDKQLRVAGVLGLSRRARPATSAIAEWAAKAVEPEP
jgi:hypothetical protein